jgi:membrane protease YdiL (CAAX protease family)
VRATSSAVFFGAAPILAFARDVLRCFFSLPPSCPKLQKYIEFNQFLLVFVISLFYSYWNRAASILTVTIGAFLVKNAFFSVFFVLKTPSHQLHQGTRHS